MFKFFESIANLVGIIVNFVVSAFEMVIFIVTQIPRCLTYLVGIIAYLPPFLGTFVMLFISVIVIINLINKGS